MPQTTELLEGPLDLGEVFIHESDDVPAGLSAPAALEVQDLPDLGQGEAEGLRACRMNRGTPTSSGTNRR